MGMGGWVTSSTRKLVCPKWTFEGLWQFFHGLHMGPHVLQGRDRELCTFKVHLRDFGVVGDVRVLFI